MVALICLALAWASWLVLYGFCLDILLDALSSNQQAASVVELSLNPLFRRDYNSLYKGIQEFLPHQTDDKYE